MNYPAASIGVSIEILYSPTINLQAIVDKYCGTLYIASK
jgi:hypothetical protein